MAQPKNFLVDIDLNKGQLLNFKYQNLATHPNTTGWAGIHLGFTYYNTADKIVYTWDGTDWTGSYHLDHTGDVTSSKDGVTTISNDVVTNAKLAKMPANTLKGNNTGVLADAIDLTKAQVLAFLNVADGAQVNVATNLGQLNRNNTTLDITSSTGANTTLPQATSTLAGLMSGTDKTKLDGLVTNAASNLSLGTITATALTINNSDGTGVTLPVAVATTAAGLLSGADKAKLDGIAAGAQVNVSTNLAIGTVTGTTVPITNSNGTGFTLLEAIAGGNAGLLSGADKTKINTAILSSTTDISAALWAAVATDLGAAGASNQKVATQLAVKTYVDNLILTNGSLVYKGGYNASTNAPLLDATPIAGIKTGWTYVVTAAGVFFTVAVEAGDMLIALQDNPTLEAHWTIVNKNIPDVLTTLLAGLPAATNVVISAADSIIGAFAKLQGQISNNQDFIVAGTTAQYWRGDKTWQTLNTSVVPEGTNLYFTAARVLATALAGFASTTGTITTADTVLSAFNKLNGNVALKAPSLNAVLTGATANVSPAAGDNSLALATTAFVKAQGYSTTTGTVRKAIATIGDAVALSYNVAHSLGAETTAQARFASDNSVVECEIIIGATSVTFNFNVAPTAGQIKVVILG